MAATIRSEGNGRVLPRHVGDSAVTALGRCSEVPAELAGTARRVDDQVGVHLVAVHPDSDGAFSLAADVIDVTDPQRDAGLCLGR